MYEVTPGTSRTHVQVALQDGRIYQAPSGTPLQAFIQYAEAETNTPSHQRAVAAMIDNRLRELTIPVTHDLHVRPVMLMESDGALIYRRSLCFLMVAAAETCRELKGEADEVICAQTPTNFSAVGLWYEDFSQTTDEEVKDLLAGFHKP